LTGDNVSTRELEPKAEEMRRVGASVIYLAVDGRFSGLLAVADPVKTTTAGFAEAITDATIG